MTPDGKFIAFAARDGAGIWQIFRHDRDPNGDGIDDSCDRETIQVTFGDGDSIKPAISDDGTRIAFESAAASGLVPLDVDGSTPDVFLADIARDLRACTYMVNTTMISLDSAGVQDPLGCGPSFGCYSPSISGNGLKVAFLTAYNFSPGIDSNGPTCPGGIPPCAPCAGGETDVYLRDTLAATTTVVSIGTSGSTGSGGVVLSGHLDRTGNFVAFDTERYMGFSTSTRNVYVRDLATPQTHQITTAGGSLPTLSSVTGGPGSYTGSVAHENGVGNIEVFDLATMSVIATSASAGTLPRISDTGLHVVFHDLSPGKVKIFDTATMLEATVDRGNGTTSWFGLSQGPPDVSSDGAEVALYTTSSDLVPMDTNGVQDVFVERSFFYTGSFCDGFDGSLTNCPCNNPGNADSGCDIAQGTGGVKATVLAQTTSPNGMTIQGTGFPSSTTPVAQVFRTSMAGAALFVGPGGATVFNDGITCFSPVQALVRLGGIVQASGGVSTHTFGHGAGPGFFHYQIYFRNSPDGYCDPTVGKNQSNGVTTIW